MKKITRLIETKSGEILMIYDDGNTMPASEEIIKDILNNEPSIMERLTSKNVFYDAQAIQHRKDRELKKRELLFGNLTHFIYTFCLEHNLGGSIFKQAKNHLKDRLNFFYENVDKLGFGENE